jgi:hypothetical protein
MQTVQLFAGKKTQPIEFLFKACGGRVTGMVLDDTYGDGVSGVPMDLLLADGQSSPTRVQSDANGFYVFEGVPPGEYSVCLQQSKFTSSDATMWIPSPSAAPEHMTRKIKVSASTTTTVATFRLMREKHTIWGYALGSDHKEIPFAEIEIQDGTGNTISRVIADAKGRYEYDAPEPGNHLIVPVEKHGGVPSRKYPVYVNQPQQQNVHFFGSGGHGAPQPTAPPQNGEFRESVADATAYPILTEEVSYRAAPRTTAAAASGGMGLGQVVEGALRDVLSWRPKANDAKGFSAALGQAFTLTEVEGRTEATWTPRSYTVQSDMGAITGAQASIYTRAKAALDQSLPLLEGLYPLVEIVSAEDRESIRGIVRTQLEAVVNEFGEKGGPRVARVDELFSLLLGGDRQLPTKNPELLPEGALLKTLADRLALRRTNVNTIADEQNYSNFLILVDYFIGLQQSWNDLQRQFFTRGQDKGPEPFFGTQLVLLSRALEVVAESVQEVSFAMDSVFLGPAERQTTELEFANQTIQLSPPTEPDDRDSATYTFPGGTSPLFVAELLDWVDRFATKEGISLVQDGGKDGIKAFRRITDDLRKFMHGALIKHSVGGGRVDGAQERGSLPPGFSTPRVQRALQELANQLDETHKLAFPIQSPQFSATD